MRSKDEQRERESVWIREGRERERREMERGNTQQAPLVITTATTESFVCALLPQSIVAQ